MLNKDTSLAIKIYIPTQIKGDNRPVYKDRVSGLSLAVNSTEVYFIVHIRIGSLTA